MTLVSFKGHYQVTYKTGMMSTSNIYHLIAAQIYKEV